MSRRMHLFDSARRRTGGTPPATPPTATHLITESSGTDATSYTTSSVTPAANKLLLLFIGATAATTPATLAVTGNGLTWVQHDQTPAASRGVYLFRAVGAAPTTGAITISAGATTLTGCGWTLVQFTGADITGTNGSAGIIQTITERLTGNTSTATAPPAFTTTPLATSAAFAGVHLNQASAITAGANWTVLGDVAHATPAGETASMVSSPAQPNVSASWSTPCNDWVIAAEVKAA